MRIFCSNAQFLQPATLQFMNDEAITKKNILLHKIKRTFTSVLPISERRIGNCVQCGACCRLPVRCPFLKNGFEREYSYCSVYFFRPPNCRKYPRTSSELITADTCGYDFRKSARPRAPAFSLSFPILIRSFIRKFMQPNE